MFTDRPAATPAPAAPAARGGDWRLQAALAGAGILIGSYDLAAISVAFAPLEHRWQLTGAVVATLGTATLVGMLLGSLVTGLLADRLGRRALVIGDVILFVLSAAAGTSAGDFAVLIAARLATGVAVGVDFAVVFPFVAEIAPALKRGRALVWIMWAANFGTLLAYGAGGLLLRALPVNGWRATLALGGLLALPLLLLRGSVGEPAAWRAARLQRTGSILRAVASPGRRRRLSAFTLATFCYQIGDQGLGLVLPLLLVTVLGTSASSGALHAALIKAITIPASTLTVVFIERWGRRGLQLYGFLGRALAFLALGVLLMAVVHLSALLVGGLLAVGYFFGAAGPDKTTVIVPAEAFPSEIRGTSQGISQAGGRLGGIVGVTAYGVLAQIAGPGAGIMLFGAAALIGAGLTLLPERGAFGGRSMLAG